jgi:hypothetical protein
MGHHDHLGVIVGQQVRLGEDVGTVRSLYSTNTMDGDQIVSIQWAMIETCDGVVSCRVTDLVATSPTTILGGENGTTEDSREE